MQNPEKLGKKSSRRGGAHPRCSLWMQCPQPGDGIPDGADNNSQILLVLHNTFSGGNDNTFLEVDTDPIPSCIQRVSYPVQTALSTVQDKSLARWGCPPLLM